jgi:predicted P-loop ATPase
VGRYFLINAARRIFEPGCIMRSLPVLEGAQDKGKSRALRALAQPWFSDTTFKVGDKDAFQQIQGIWIYEISELESFSRVEATQVKAFVSSTEDNFRAPYERQNERHARQTVFAATTNATEYLKDWTGNTRFWPLLCGDRIDLDGIAAVREQLFAEAVVLYHAGERAFPTLEQQLTMFGPEQDRRLMAHPWLSLINDYLNPPGGRKDRTTVIEILLDCIGIKPDKMNPQGGEAQRVGQALHAMGWKKVRASDARRTWQWLRPELDPDLEDAGDIPF